MIPPCVPRVEIAKHSPHLFRCLAFLNAERRNLAAWFDDPRRRDALEKSVYFVVIERTYIFGTSNAAARCQIAHRQLVAETPKVRADQSVDLQVLASEGRRDHVKFV